MRCRVIQGKAEKLLRHVGLQQADLVFADPPFNIGYSYDVYEDKLTDNQYLSWSRDWLEQVYRCLKPTGTFWLAIGDEYAAEMKLLTQSLGFIPRSWVIWYYTFGVACQTKFSRCHTHLMCFTKHKKNFTFNADDVRIPSDRQTKYGPKDGSGDPRANPKGKLPDDVWIYPRVCGTFKERVGWHKCQMPIAPLERIIASCSNEDDLVVDPFAGSGTTLVAATKLGRRSIGVELSENYCSKMRERVENECN